MRSAARSMVALAVAVLALSTMLMPGAGATIQSAGSAADGSPAPASSAPGGPGSQSYLDSSRKDCFGTAADTSSKAWFTVAGGVAWSVREEAGWTR